MNHCCVQNVRVCAGRQVILDDVSLSVSQGEWLSIVGPNGAGKSTLLSVMAGLKSTSGSVRVADIDIADMTPRQRAHHMAYLPQHPEVPPGMSVGGYVLIGRNPHIPLMGSEGQRDIEILNEVLEQLSLEDFRDRTLDSLSGGELQRFAIAVCAVQESDVYMFDEPSSYLDVKQRMTAAAVFRTIVC